MQSNNLIFTEPFQTRIKFHYIYLFIYLFSGSSWGKQPRKNERNHLTRRCPNYSTYVTGFCVLHMPSIAFFFFPKDIGNYLLLVSSLMDQLGYITLESWLKNGFPSGTGLSRTHCIHLTLWRILCLDSL